MISPAHRSYPEILCFGFGSGEFVLGFQLEDGQGIRKGLKWGQEGWQDEIRWSHSFDLPLQGYVMIQRLI